MAWYTTGTIAVSGTTVTGTGTNWLDNKQSIGAGQALLIPGSGTVKMYEIASVTSATKLTLKTSPGTIAAGQAYAILSFYTDSVPDFARRLAAQLSYYQSQMDGWQQIMTGTGNVTLTAPDGTSVTISSFSKLTSDIASAFQQRGNIGSNRDLNTMGPTSEFVGVWGISTTADLTGLTNSPESNGGELDIYPYGSYGCTQKLTTRYGNIWVRCPTANWTAANPDVWGAWCLVGSMYYSSNTKDMNALLTPVKYFSNNITNGPSGMTSTLYAFISVEVNTAMNIVKQSLEYSASGRIFTRVSNNGTWSAWAEVMTSNTTVPIANGGTGKNNIADAKSAMEVSFTRNTQSWSNMESIINAILPNGGTAALRDNTANVSIYQYSTAFIARNSDTYSVIDVNHTDGNVLAAGWASGKTVNGNALWGSKNTTVDSNGFIKKASPIVRVFYGDTLPSDYTMSGFARAGQCMANEEAEGVSVTRISEGVYELTGSLGPATEGWTVEIPQDANGYRQIYVQTEFADGKLLIQTYHRVNADAPSFLQNLVNGKKDGDAIDIPEGRWIDLRLSMPPDSAYNMRIKQATEDAATAIQDENSDS